MEVSSKRYELVVFDWDGTVLDSTMAIVGAVQSACQDLGLDIPTAEHAKQVIGLGLEDALRHSAPSLPSHRMNEFVDRYRYHYLTNDGALSLFDGIEHLIQKLFRAGFMLGVATGKSRKGLDRALLHSNLRPFFVSTRCADECHSKPHPQMLLELMDELGVDAEKTLMIGDTTHDLLMAQNAGVDAIAVAYGAHAVTQLREYEPLAICHSVESLAAVLSKELASPESGSVSSGALGNVTN